MDNGRCRKIVSDILEGLAGDIIKLTGCQKSWGEVELPDCLRDQEDDFMLPKSNR